MLCFLNFFQNFIEVILPIFLLIICFFVQNNFVKIGCLTRTINEKISSTFYNIQFNAIVIH